MMRGDIAEVRTGEGKICLFVAIDRTSKFAYVELHEKAGKMIAARFLRNLIAAVPYRIHTILTPSHGLQANHCRAMDNGIQFTNRKQDTSAFEHIFDRICREHEIEHRLTKVNHPWTNGQVERPPLGRLLRNRLPGNGTERSRRRRSDGITTTPILSWKRTSPTSLRLIIMRVA